MMRIDELRDFNASFGIILLHYRQLLNVTLPALSQETDIPLPVLEKIELGRLQPNQAILETLSTFFNEDFSLLFHDVPKRIH